jgi:hypothetical protein
VEISTNHMSLINYLAAAAVVAGSWPSKAQWVDSINNSIDKATLVTREESGVATYELHIKSSDNSDQVMWTRAVQDKERQHLSDGGFEPPITTLKLKSFIKRKGFIGALFRQGQSDLYLLVPLSTPKEYQEHYFQGLRTSFPGMNLQLIDIMALRVNRLSEMENEEGNKLHDFKLDEHFNFWIDGQKVQIPSSESGSYPHFHPHSFVVKTVTKDGVFSNGILEWKTNGVEARMYMRFDVPFYDPALDVGGVAFVKPDPLTWASRAPPGYSPLPTGEFRLQLPGQPAEQPPTVPSAPGSTAAQPPWLWPTLVASLLGLAIFLFRRLQRPS